MREWRDERRERNQVSVQDLADRGFDVHHTGAGMDSRIPAMLDFSRR